MKLGRRHIKIITIAASIVVVALVVIGYILINGLNPAVQGSQYSQSQLSEKEDRDFVENDAAPEGMKKVYKDRDLILFINEENAEIAVYDERTEQYWHSNPVDAQDDPLAVADQKNRLLSQIYVEYYDHRQQRKTMDSYFFSVNQETFEIVPIKNGVRVEFNLGRREFTRQMLPQVIEVERFEELILSKIDDEDLLSIVERRYRKMILSELDSHRYDEYKEAYEALDDDTPYYILNLNTPQFDFEPLYEAIFDLSDYTYEDLEEDNLKHGIFEEIVLPEIFFIPIEYTLESGEFVATIPCSAIETPELAYIREIHVLEFFGAGGVGDEGYVLMPDGSGSLVRFNNEKTRVSSYRVSVYGNDGSIRVDEAPSAEFTASLPVFAIQKNDYGFLAIIEEGEANASVNASVSEISNSYNNGYASFGIRPVDFMRVISGSTSITTNKYQEERYQGNLRIRYCFTQAYQSDLVGFANLYKEKLIEEGVLEYKEDPSVPFIVEFIGNVETRENLFGIPYTGYKTITSFDQASDIVLRLHDYGVGTPDVIFSNWFTGPSKTVFGAFSTIARGMGGRRGLEELSGILSENDSKIYLNTAVIRNDNSLLGFMYPVYGNRYTFNNVVARRPFNIATRLPDRSERKQRLVSTRYLPDYIEKLYKRMNGFEEQDIWFSDLGSDLNSDFRRNNNIDRQVAMELTEKSLGIIESKDMGFFSPNKYAFEYASVAAKIPFESSGHRMQDESVPFLQFVLAGCLDYTGSPINLSGKSRDDMLASVQTGAGLYFRWIYADNTQIREFEGPQPQRLFSLNYEEWIEEASTFYTRMVDETSIFYNRPITGYEKLDQNVYRTTWENGSVIVNYNSFPVDVERISIGAKDFYVLTP